MDFRGEKMATQNVLKEKTISKVNEPKKFNVVMYNDDFRAFFL